MAFATRKEWTILSVMVGDVILFTSKLNLFKTKLVSQAYAHSKQTHLSTLSNMVNGLNPGVSKVCLV